MPLCFRLRASAPSCLRAFVPPRLCAFVPLCLCASVPFSPPVLSPVCSSAVRAPFALRRVSCPSLALRCSSFLFASASLCAPELGVWEFGNWFFRTGFWDWLFGLAFLRFFFVFYFVYITSFFFCLAARRTSPREEGGDVTAWTVPCCCAFLFGARASLVP